MLSRPAYVKSGEDKHQETAVSVTGLGLHKPECRLIHVKFDLNLYY